MFPELSSISYRRKRAGITQKILSKKANISQSLLTKIERGLVIPNYKTACAIFDILDEFEYNNDKTLNDVMKRNIIILKSSDTVQKTAIIAKKHSISQFPVLENGKIVGAITTNNLINIGKNI